MSKPKKGGSNGLMKFLAQPYRLMSINKSSLEERQITEFKGYQLLVFGIYSALVLFVVSFLLIAYSPVKNLVPQTGFSKNKKVIELMINIDSLERSLFLQNQYTLAIFFFTISRFFLTFFILSFDPGPQFKLA